MTSTSAPPPELTHNLDPTAFMWLWAKYVVGFNTAQHCTAVLRGKYSKALSRHNPNLSAKPMLALDELLVGSYSAIYICGVDKKRYAAKKNYPHNLHAVIQPRAGESDKFVFERWQLSVRNGVFLPIPPPDELPQRHRSLPEEFTACRIFRWAAVTEAAGQVGLGPAA